MSVESTALLLGCLETFDDVRLSVRGACMAPAAGEGERVRVVAASRRPPRFGDVVLVATRDGLRLHRLVWPLRPGSAQRLRTMADRARALDARFDAGAVLGVATVVERAAGAVEARDRGRALRGLLRAVWTRLGPARARRP
jgi:hypothetical protein